MFLPDGKHFLFLAIAPNVTESMYRVGSIDSKETQPFAPAQSQITNVEPGYLLFLRDRTLVAQPFDAKTMKTTGEPVPLAEQVGTDNVGLARFSVSREGTLAYRTGEMTDRLVWVDRSGKELETEGDPSRYTSPHISPDGRRIAFDVTEARIGKSDVWIRDLTRKVSSRFSFSKGNASTPTFSPDGSRIVYSVENDLVERSADGQGAETTIGKFDGITFVTDWSADGQSIAFASQGKGTAFDIWIMPGSGDRKPHVWLQTPFSELNAAFSPDGRYLAYQSNESGRQEIYVQSYPGPGGKWQVSSSGGSQPHWRGDGKELFFRTPDQKIMAVEVTTGATFEAGVPKALFPIHLDPNLARNHFVPSKDGQRFLLVATPARDAIAPTTVVLNWFADLGK